MNNHLHVDGDGDDDDDGGDDGDIINNHLHGVHQVWQGGGRQTDTVDSVHFLIFLGFHQR